jgi:glyoxylase-like metal-dependent hydrolase (beta-lactamase superfamily II)
LIISHYHTDHLYGAKAFKEKGTIIIAQKKVLISRDIVFGGRVPFLGSGNSKSWIECLDKILELEPEVLLLGHGEPLFGKKNIKRQVAWTKKYIQDIRSVVKKLYKEGLSLEEVHARANEEMPKIDTTYSQLPVFFDVNPVNAYHPHFEIEREVLFESKQFSSALPVSDVLVCGLVYSLGRS